MSNIAALDLGSTVGMCRIDQHGGDAAWSIAHQEMDGDHRGDKFLSFWRWLDKVLDGVTVVAFEEVRFNRGFTYIPGQIAMLKVQCVRRRIAYVGVGVSELKKWATGDGRASKDEMVREAESRLEGRGVAWGRAMTDDEADAALVAMWALENAIGEDR